MHRSPGLTTIAPPAVPLPVVLVTGTSSGIGLALARRLRGLPYRTVATARATSLHRLADAGLTETDRFHPRALDVTDPHQREELIEEVTRQWGGVDILVNNAGVSFRAVIEHLSEAETLDQLAVNFLGPMDLIRLVLPHMRGQMGGRIINVSSVGGMMAMPTMGAYSASKFALEGASEALWYEMRPWNIRVSLVQPGFIRSDSFTHTYMSARARSSVAAADEYEPYYSAMGDFIARLMGRAFATPDTVARRIVSLMTRKRPPLRVSATLDARFFYILRRLLPRRVYHRILYHSLPTPGKWVDRTDARKPTEESTP
jgi:NAD(P)-dependent dehydrogenase (short-subunit alcohol dehydrogenase family)